MTAESFGKLLAAATLLAGAVIIPGRRAGAQDTRCERGDTEVRSLQFTGNRTFTSSELADVIVTSPSAWARRYLDFPLSRKRCLDRAVLGDDRLRLLLFYRRRGFPQVAVDTIVQYPESREAEVTFAIREGAPTLLRSVTVMGLDSVRGGAALARGVRQLAGGRFDRSALDAAGDSIVRHLRNAGYPAASATNRFAVTPVPAAVPAPRVRGVATPAGSVATDTLAISTGPITHFGAVEIEVQPAPGRKQHIPDRSVRHIVGIDSGSLYREQALLDAQRALYQTNAYQHVAITLDPARGTRAGSDSILPVRIAVVENTMHAARVGAGYGTLDCFRTTAELDDYNFLAGARTLQLQARLSKIGVGRPFDGASGLCPQARRDPYSSRVNYFLGATIQQPVFLGLNTVPAITAYTARVSEYNAYVRTTAIGGVASVLWQSAPRTPVTFAYSMDVGRTEAQPALFCAVFNLCARDERERVQRTQRLGVLSVQLVHDATNIPAAPTSGSVVRLEVRHSSPVVFSDTARFNTLIADLSRYTYIGGGTVFAVHLRAGSVFGRGFIPPQERMYAGGPTSVRGFVQNELGDATYIASGYDTVRVAAPSGEQIYFRVADSVARPRRVVPVGGNSLVVANAELRLRSPILPDLLQFGVFTDVGEVWSRGIGDAFRSFRLKVTPGVQAAALTPVGPIRLVVGYNPYPHPPGPLYYESSAAAGGALPCVSPGNTIPVTVSQSGELVQSEKRCPASFRPRDPTSFRSRLTFGLAIGQAF